jgi:hypothetical protein
MSLTSYRAALPRDEVKKPEYYICLYDNSQMKNFSSLFFIVFAVFLELFDFS